MNIDLSYLEEITEGDKDMMLEMLTLFVEDIPNQVEAIQKHAADQNLAGVGSESHKLKPTLQYAGLHSLYQTVKRLEVLGKAGVQTEEVSNLIVQLGEETEEALASLEEKKKDFV